MTAAPGTTPEAARPEAVRPDAPLLVTGGAGFIGSHFVRMLLQAEPERPVTVLDKLTYAGNPANLDPVRDAPGFRFVRGDIADPAVVDELAAEHRAIVNFAAESHVDRSIDAARAFTLTNVLGTQTLLDAALRHRHDRFLQVSTDEVYGSIAHGSWNERQPLDPSSPYSASKAGADLAALAYHRTHGLPVVVTRCTNNYGPYQHPEKLIPLFTTRLLDGYTVPLYGEGDNIRDWLHVDDHCRALLLALERGRPGEVYHIGGGTELTNKELTGLLLRACGADWAMVERVPDRKGHDLRYALDWSKARQQLGYRPRTGFAEGLAATVEWYRSRRDWWDPAAAGPESGAGEAT